jgi:hypothetical protein
VDVVLVAVDVVLVAVEVALAVVGVPSQSLCPRRAGEKIAHILDNNLTTFSFQVDCR